MPDKPVDFETERMLAIFLNNRAWELLDLGSNRTLEQELEMIDCAHASNWHWLQVGGLEQAVIGAWLLSRVHAVAGDPVASNRYAQRAADLFRGGTNLPDWLHASVLEGQARALLSAGDHVAATEALRLAREALDEIQDPDDRSLIESQLEELRLQFMDLGPGSPQS